MKWGHLFTTAILSFVIMMSYPGYHMTFAEGGSDPGEGATEWNIYATSVGPGSVTTAFENNEGTYNADASESDRTISWAADENCEVQSVTINEAKDETYAGQTTGSYVCTEGNVTIHIVFIEASNTDQDPEEWKLSVTSKGPGNVTTAFVNNAGTYNSETSEADRTVSWAADENCEVQSVTINEVADESFADQTSGQYICNEGNVDIHIVFTEKEAEANPYRDFLERDGQCVVQTPEAGDTYVTAFVKLPTDDDIEAGITKKYIYDNLKVEVTIGSGSTHDATALLDETKEGDRFAFTSQLPTVSPINKGGQVEVKFYFPDSEKEGENLAEVSSQVTATAAPGKTTYTKKTVTLSVTPVTKEYTYNGKENKTKVTITGTAGGQTYSNVALGDSYELKYSGTKSAAGGKNKAQVKVIMEGDFEGTGTATYSILPREIIIKTIKPKTSAYVYNGSARKSGVTLTAVYKDTGKAVPAAILNDTASNVRLDYEKTVNVGTAKVTATMKNNYKSASKSATYTVKPKGTEISKLTAQSKGFTVKWSAQKTKMKTFYITGYQVRYSLKSNMGSAKTVTVGTKENKDYKLTSKKITKLKAKKKYYVQVRTYKKLNGKMYYSNWSDKRSIKTK